MNETKYKQIQQLSGSRWLSSALVVILLHHSQVCIIYWKFDLQSGNNIAAINCEMKPMSLRGHKMSPPDGLRKKSRWLKAGLLRETFCVGHNMRAVIAHQINSSLIYRM